MNADVAIARCRGGTDGPYPPFPYAPGTANGVYSAVRTCLELLGFDRSHAQTADWNPLGDIIRPGQQVLIKPNWVFHENHGPGGLASLVTDTSVLRPLIDYALRALDGRGRLLIGDAPLQSADFAVIIEQSRIASLVASLDLRGTAVEVRDFRQNVCQLDSQGWVVDHRKTEQAPEDFCTVDLGPRSLLCEVAENSRRFRVTNYDPTVMQAHHTDRRHEYLIAKAVLESDVVISVPKLKTHRKAGLTCCLKNVVGINGSKDYLPHHRVGPPCQGGDEYAWPSFWKACGSKLLDRLEKSPGGAFRRPYRLALRVCRRMAHHCARDPYDEGSWHGNDTVWRMALDLNRILEYARPDGSIAEVPQRRILNIVDGVIAGGGEGPLCTDAVEAGFILAGEMPSAVDAVAARLVGLDPEKMPLVRNALSAAETTAGGPPRIRLLDAAGYQGECPLAQIRPLVRIRPPCGWMGHVELASSESDGQDVARVPAATCLAAADG
jgi:uncharacterized protein (DUF362 family)